MKNDLQINHYLYHSLLNIVFCVVTELLWKAPEILRSPETYPKGSQKADVYSFAIVLHEIVLRKGPFGMTGLPAEGKNNFVQQKVRLNKTMNSIIQVHIQKHF